MQEHRREERDPLRIEVRYQDSSGNILRGTVFNISLSGVYIKTEKPLDLGVPLNLGLDVVDLGKVIAMHGWVVRVEPHDGMAVEFTDRQSDALKELISMIKRIPKASAMIQEGSGQNRDNVLKNIREMTNNTNRQQYNGAPVKDKRRHSRKSLRIEARYQDNKGTVLKGVVRNISISGIFIDTRYPLDIHSHVRLSLDAEDIGKVIDVQGKVVRVEPNNGMGIEFTQKEDRDVKLLLHAMRRLDQASLLALSRSGLGE